MLEAVRYNITQFQPLNNGTLIVVVAVETIDELRSQEESLMFIQIQEPGELVL